jgi:alkyl hydroperoxide reductase subunit AhpC
VLGDPDGAVAKAYGMRVPRGGGPPVGYAVVDAAGAIRYRTLDPAVAERLREVGTIVSAFS